MTMEAIGSTPSGSNEYVCSECGKYFEIAVQDHEGNIDYETEVKFCPVCGAEHDS